MCDIVPGYAGNTDGDALYPKTIYTINPEVEKDEVAGEYLVRTKSGNQRIFCKHPGTDWHDMTDDVKVGDALFCPAGTEVKIVEADEG